MVAQPSLNQEQSYALLSKTECLFAAIWHNPEGVVSTEKIASYYEVSVEAIANVMQFHHEEFEITEDNWTPRDAIRLGMLLKSPQAARVRSLALDVIEAHKKKSKKEQIAYLLQNSEFVRWSNREIAKVLECSHTTVNEVRLKLESENKVVEFKSRKHIRNGKEIDRELPKQTENTIENNGGKWKLGFHEQGSNPDSTVGTKSPFAIFSSPGDPRDGMEVVVREIENNPRQMLADFPTGTEVVSIEHLSAPSSPYTPTRTPAPRTYTEDELQQEINRAIQEAKIGELSRLREQAEKEAQEQLNAARAIASQRALEVAKLQQRIDELESLRSLEVENQILKQRIQDLENSMEPRACQEWGTKTFTKEAVKVLNAEVVKTVENLEPELHLRTMAKEPPQSNPRGTVTLLGLSLVSMANGHPRLASELRKAAAIVLGVEEKSLDAKKQQLEQLPQAIALFKQTINSNPTWDGITKLADQYNLIKQEIWLELTQSERDTVDRLKVWGSPREWDGCKYQPVGKFALIHNGDRWLVIPSTESFTTPMGWLEAWQEGNAKEGAIAYADQYTVAYKYHGTVEDIRPDQIKVRWQERKGQSNECEWYEVGELRMLIDG